MEAWSGRHELQDKLRKEELVKELQKLHGQRLKSLLEAIEQKEAGIKNLREEARKQRQLKSKSDLEYLRDVVQVDPEGQVREADVRLYELVRQSEYETGRLIAKIARKNKLMGELENMHEQKLKKNLELVQLNEDVKMKADKLNDPRHRESMERFEALLIQKNDKITDLSRLKVTRASAVITRRHIRQPTITNRRSIIIA